MAFTQVNDNLAFDIIKTCGGIEFSVYYVVLSHRNRLTGKCFPSIECIMAETGYSRSKVKRAIDKLHENEFLIIDSGRQGISNSYFFPKEDFYNNEGIGASRRNKGNFQNKC